MKVLALVALAGAAGLAILVSNLSFVAQKAVHAKFDALIQDLDLDFEISRLSLTRGLILDVRYGKGVCAEKILLDWAVRRAGPRSFRFDPQTLSVSGLSINLVMDETGRVYLDGKGPSDDSAGPVSTAGIQQMLSFLPETLTISRAKLTLRLQNRDIILPFDVTVFLNREENKADCRVHLFFAGDRFELTMVADLSSPDQVFENPLSLVQDLKFSGTQLHPGTLAQLFGVDFPRFSGTCDVAVNQKGTHGAGVRLSRLGLVYPVQAEITNFTADLGFTPRGLAVDTRFDLGCSHIQQAGIQLSGDQAQTPLVLPVSGRISVNRSGQGADDWAVKLEAQTLPVKAVTLDMGKDQLCIHNPFLAADLKGGMKTLGGNVLIRSDQVRVKHGPAQLEARSFELDSTLDSVLALFGENGEKNGEATAAFTSKMSGIKAAVNGVTGSVKAVEKQGTVYLARDRPVRFNIRTRLVNGNAALVDAGATLIGISADLSYAHPFDDRQAREGRYSISLVQTGSLPGVTVSGSLIQTGPMGVKFSGKAGSKEVEPLNVSFSGMADLENHLSAKINARFSRTRLTSDQIGPLFPELARAGTFELDVSGNAGAVYDGTGVKTRAGLEIHQGHMVLGETGVKVEGIKGAIEFNDLICPESLPGQLLTIDTVESGKVKFSDIRARFSIEDGSFLNLENLRAGWCSGLISTEAARFPSKDMRHTLILYCDRLNLSGLLAQMGSFEAEGTGTLSGRIPVVISQDGMAFENGFLFSTPGTGGRIKIVNTQGLLAGIPMGTPQFGQLDLAAEALKEFDYDWAKLKLNTHEDTLSANLELYGKPSKVLPFEYKKEIGSFVRVGARSPGSRFQGIQLDVNLKLPFNKMVKFGNQLVNLFEDK